MRPPRRPPSGTPAGPAGSSPDARSPRRRWPRPGGRRRRWRRRRGYGSTSRTPPGKRRPRPRRRRSGSRRNRSCRWLRSVASRLLGSVMRFCQSAAAARSARFSIRSKEGSEQMAEVVTLGDAVAELVADGDTVALEGFTHLIPHAAGHELIRQRRRRLTLVRLTPDVIYDQMIGMGCADRMIFSWGGHPGVGSLHRFRPRVGAAVVSSWPVPLAIEAHSLAGMAAAFAAGAATLPFGVLRGYAGTDLP